MLNDDTLISHLTTVGGIVSDVLYVLMYIISSRNQNQVTELSSTVSRTPVQVLSETQCRYKVRPSAGTKDSVQYRR